MHADLRIGPDSYALDMSVQIDNLADEPQDLAYRLEGANGITLEGWWYSNKISPNLAGGAAARDIVYKTAASGHRCSVAVTTLLKRAKKETKDPNRNDLCAGDSSQRPTQLEIHRRRCPVLHRRLSSAGGNRRR